MKRSLDEPSTSTGKRTMSRLLTTQQVIDAFDVSDGEDLDCNVYDSDSDSSFSDNDNGGEIEDLSSDFADRDRFVRPQERRGRVPTTADRGDSPVVNEMGWTSQFIQSNVDLEFDDSGRGPINLPDILTADSEPLEFLSLFVDGEFWDNLTRMTNLRAQQTRRVKPNSYHAKAFKDVSVEEMKAFIGLRIHMEYLTIKPSYRDYWTNDGKDSIGFMPGFRNVMTRDRFLAIWTFLHVVDEEDETIDKTDKVYKVRPLFEKLLVKFRHHYNPRKHLSLDEGMIPTKNRLAIKQYIKDKPTKWGIKSFLLCEGETGYVLNAEIYTGAAAIIDQSLGIVGNTVVRLLTSCGLDGKAHVLVMDRYYNSIILSEYALDHMRTGVVGTIQTNRKLFPASLKNVKKLKRGENRHLCRGSVTCLVWQDRKPIPFISNYHDPSQVVRASRRNKDGSLLDIEMPQIVKDYNLYMGGCDKNDQMTRLHRSRRHYRWPRRLFIKCFMWACYNSYVIYKTHTQAGAKKQLHFTRYIQQLCLSLVGNYRSSAIINPRNAPCPVRLTSGQHFPETPIDASSDHLCAVCMEKHTRHKKQNPGVAYKDNPHKKVKSTIRCSLCQKYLCVKRGSTCWSDWHTKVEYWR